MNFINFWHNDPEQNNHDQEEDTDGDDLFQQNAAHRYKRLITICAQRPKGRLRDSLKMDHDIRRLSLSEQEFEKAAESHRADLVRYFILNAHQSI